jgi:hypothetical protein
MQRMQSHQEERYCAGDLRKKPETQTAPGMIAYCSQIKTEKWIQILE